MNVSFKKETVIDNDFRTNNEDYLKVLSDLMDYALEMCDGDVEEANDLVFQYMRDGRYDDFNWRYTAGKINTKKTEELRQKLNQNGFLKKHYIMMYMEDVERE